jgi:uncharacterized membrane protein
MAGIGILRLQKPIPARHIQLRMILNWTTRHAMLSDLVKSGTWAVVQMAIGFAVGTAVTGSIGFGACIAVLASSIGSFAYWLHERLWKAYARR